MCPYEAAMIKYRELLTCKWPRKVPKKKIIEKHEPHIKAVTMD